ncbi:hypothetical protein QBC34DRAFT_27373 [Podospora aff. communis PSN243]|uniref:Uncharacterized protein n=1 Tax=Podospora aff. communis PSN243 TaxID=3040156 RepID=A0AAV9GWE0_9PEZI|nr:hypothetical protein QBC34DRAFT_27373 [Podospora aff. communis PSN243]
MLPCMHHLDREHDNLLNALLWKRMPERARGNASEVLHCAASTPSIDLCLQPSALAVCRDGIRIKVEASQGMGGERIRHGRTAHFGDGEGAGINGRTRHWQVSGRRRTVNRAEDDGHDEKRVSGPAERWTRSVGGIFKYGFLGVEVVDFQPKNCQISPVATESWMHLGMDFAVSRKHTVFLVTLPGDTKVVIDRTGAQYGWKEFLAPWDKYKQHRVLCSLPPTNLPFRPHGFQQRPYHPSNFEIVIDTFDPKRACCDQHHGSRPRLAVSLAQFLSHHIATNFGGPVRLLLQNHANFKAARRNIAAATKVWLAEKMEYFSRRDDFRYYVTPSKQLDIAFGKTCDILKEVWLSKEEYEEHKDDPDELWRIYRERWEKAPWKDLGGEGIVGFDGGCEY